MLLKILKIHGHSMQPVIADGKKVLVTSIFYLFSNPKKDDIVAFKFDNKIFVKRIGYVSENKYFLQGDNKKDSLDSGKIGLIERRNILGKVLVI